MARVGGTAIACDIFVCKSAGKRSHPRHCVDGRVTIKTGLEEILCGLDTAGTGYVAVAGYGYPCIHLKSLKTINFLVSHFGRFQHISLLFGGGGGWQEGGYVKGIFTVQKTVRKGRRRARKILSYCLVIFGVNICRRQ
jgi:hypothetical protein